MGTDIEKIILSYLRNELSNLEKEKLERWMEEKPSNKEELSSLSEVWKTPVGYPEIVNMADEKKRIWERLQNENGKSVSPGSKTTFISKSFFRYAAAIIFFLGLGYIFWENLPPEAEMPTVVETIERINPLGQKSSIPLPDGSKVWLNAGSKLSYSREYNHNTRKLHLEGEAYFEVTKNPEIPFEVFTNNLVITALGTSFNVRAFEGKQIQEIALNTGEVKVECLDKLKKPCIASYLKPGDLASFYEHSREIKISEYDGFDPFVWKDGKIVFKNATFNEVVETLSRWYNVEFEIAGTLKQEWNYRTTFENENLENILKSLRFSEKIEYELNGSVVKIKL